MGLGYKFGTDGFHSYLHRMKLIKVDEESLTARPTGLGLLLLGQNPEEHFDQARIKFTVRSEGKNPKIRDFEGSLVLLPAKNRRVPESFIFPRGFSSGLLSKEPKMLIPHLLPYMK